MLRDSNDEESTVKVVITEESRLEIVTSLRDQGLSEEDIALELKSIQEDIQQQAEELNKSGFLDIFELFPTIH